MKQILAAVALAAGLVGSMRPASADAEGAALRSLIAKASPSIVTIRAVIKSDAGQGAQESRMEVQGAVVDPSGLIMIANSALDPSSLFAMLGAGADVPNVKSTPTSIKVVFDGDEKEYPAFQAATDTKLGLAFIQVEDLGGKRLTAIDFRDAAAPGIGDAVVCITRLVKGYDYSPYFQTGRISGIINKPRKAWKVEGNISSLGLPVYSADGHTVGVLSMVAAGVSDEGGDAAMGMGVMMKMLTGAGSGMPTFIVPGQTVYTVITQARARATQMAADRAKHPGAAPTTGGSVKKPGTTSHN